MADQHDSESKSLIVRRARVDSLSLYEVTESELQDLERGGSASLLLNFSVFLFSIAIAFLIALLSTKIESDRTFTVFVICTVIGFLGGLLLLLLWWRSWESVKEVVRRIKERMPSDESKDLDADQQDSVDRKMQ